MAALGVMALLVTGATGGRDGRRAACLDHVRQLAMASVMYAGDHGDTLPHSGWGLRGADCWAHAVQVNGQTIPYLVGKDDPTPQLPYLRAGQLWPYLRREAVFMCPQDVTERSGSPYSSWRQRDLKITSYTMNSSVIGHADIRIGAVHQLSRFAPDAFLLWGRMRPGPFSSMMR
ncbi:MAG: hypothetical protein ACKVYV_01090 [Limisphaerales bacterium]